MGSVVDIVFLAPRRRAVERGLAVAEPLALVGGLVGGLFHYVEAGDEPAVAALADSDRRVAVGALPLGERARRG